MGKYDWCYATDVVARLRSTSTECKMNTDMDKFMESKEYKDYLKEKPKYAFKWGEQIEIDDEKYRTYCNGGRPCKDSTKFDGGKINGRDGYKCLIKKEHIKDKSLIESSNDDYQTLYSSGECRTQSGGYPLQFKLGERPKESHIGYFYNKLTDLDGAFENGKKYTELIDKKTNLSVPILKEG